MAIMCDDEQSVNMAIMCDDEQSLTWQLCVMMNNQLTWQLCVDLTFNVIHDGNKRLLTLVANFIGR